MKRPLFFLLFCFLILLQSCVHESLEQKNPEDQSGGPIVLLASKDDIASKTVLSSMNIYWRKDDKISVFDGVQNFCFKTGDDMTERATFTGYAGRADRYYALYPYSDEASFTSNRINYVIPKQQYPTPGSFDSHAAIMAGCTCDGDNLPMKNCCALIKFTLQNDDVTQVYIQSTVSDEPLTGPHTAVVSNDSTVEVEARTGFSNSVACIPAKGGAFSRGTYYACVCPSSVSGVRVIVSFADGSRGSKVKKNKPCTLERNHVTDFGVIDDNITRVYEDDGTDDQTYAQSAYGFDYLALLSKQHPRLFLDGEGFIDLKRKVNEEAAANQFLKEISTLIIDNADRYLEEPVPVYEASDRLTEARLGLKHLFACSYAFQLTRNTAYLDKARADLAAFCTFDDWNTGQYLCIGETAMGVAIAYDWLYGYLSAEERELARRKLYEYAIGTYKDYYSSKFGYTSNWNEVCWSGLVAASVALFGKQVEINGKSYGNADLMELLELCVNPAVYGTNAYQLPILYGPDGSFDEGYSYWTYGTGYEVLLMASLESAFGHDAPGLVALRSSDGFLKTARFLQFIETPLITGRFGTFGYADGGASSQSIQWPMYWFAKEMGDMTILSNEVMKMREGMYTLDNCDVRLFAFLPSVIKDMNLDAQLSVPDFPSQKFWHGGNYVQMIMGRDGWSTDKKDAYFAFKGGFAGRSHGHMDVGEFIFDCNGERWSHDIPLGWTYSKASSKIQEYDPSKEYNNEDQNSGRWWFFFTNNIGHSVISIVNAPLTGGRCNPSDQLVGSKKISATIQGIIDTANEKGGTINLTPVYSDMLKSYDRTVKMVTDGGKFKKLVIVDKITTNSSFSPEIQWRMLTPANVETVSDAYQILSQNGKTIYLSTSVSGNLSAPSYHVWEAKSNVFDNWLYNVDRDYTAAFGYSIAGFTTTIQNNSSVTITTTLSTEK